MAEPIGGRYRLIFHPSDMLERLRRSPDKIEDWVSKALDDLAEQMVAAAREAAPVDTGHLRRSIDYVSPQKLVRQVGSGLKYAPWVEFGTKPHWPPFKPIRDWVWRNRGKFGMRPRSRSQTTQSSVNAIARMVQRAIAMRGTKGKSFFRPAFALVQNRMMPTIVHYLQNGISELGVND